MRRGLKPEDGRCTEKRLWGGASAPMRRGLKLPICDLPTKICKWRRLRPDEKGIETVILRDQSQARALGRRLRPDEKGIETREFASRQRSSPAHLGGASAPMRRGLKQSKVIADSNKESRGGASAPMRRGLKLSPHFGPAGGGGGI